MDKERTHGINNKKPIENHETAAWADIKKLDPESRVGIPREEAVGNAKDYVDANEK